jgi:tRNA A37 threonylcarbamoyladenosine dehydratase
MAAKQIVLAGVVGVALGAAAVVILNQRRKQSEPDEEPTQGSVQELPRHMMEEVFSRNLSFFGDEGFADIRGAFVVVVGLGGVGSHAAHMMARSGVGAMRVIDFDQVTSFLTDVLGVLFLQSIRMIEPCIHMLECQVSLSSLNRHAVATLCDVGRPKSEAMQRRLAKIVPWCAVDARAAMFKESAAAELLAPCTVGPLAGRAPDYVLDCIDDVNTKAELIGYCQTHKVPIITGCAAGAKADPTRLHMGLLSDASRDPLASKMRWKLKKQGTPLEGVVTVYSSEMPRVKLLPLTSEQLAAPAEFGVVDGMRTRGES